MHGLPQQRAKLANIDLPLDLPNSLHIVKQTPQVKGLHTFIRNKETKRCVTVNGMSDWLCNRKNIFGLTNPLLNCNLDDIICRDELVFYADRLMRILIEDAMNFVPYKSVTVELSNGRM